MNLLSLENAEKTVIMDTKINILCSI